MGRAFRAVIGLVALIPVIGIAGGVLVGTDASGVVIGWTLVGIGVLWLAFVIWWVRRAPEGEVPTSVWGPRRS